VTAARRSTAAIQSDLGPAAALARLGIRARGPVTLLGEGPVSRSYRLRLSTGEHAVLRIDKRLPSRPLERIAGCLGLDRASEAALLAYLAAAPAAVRLAESPLAADAAAGLLLRPYLAGQPWERYGQGSPLPGPQLLAAARLLAQVHATPPPPGLPVRHWRQTLTRYRSLAGPSADGLLAEGDSLLPGLPAAPVVLCHHDPGPANLVGRPPRLLDWEYAAAGNPLFDLAVLGRGLRLARPGWQALARAVAEAAGPAAPYGEWRAARLADALQPWAAFAGVVERLWLLAVAAAGVPRP
jgi:thiamine kinase